MLNDSALFIGEYEVNVDSKKRISIPSKWKEKLGLEIMISKGFEGCLNIRSRQGFNNYCASLIGTDQNDEEARKLKRLIFGSTQEISLDKWHRFVMPSKLALEIRLGGEAVLVGTGAEIEIWSKESYEEWKNKSGNNLESAGKALSKRN